MLCTLQFVKQIAICHEKCKAEKWSDSKNCEAQNKQRDFLVHYQTHDFDPDIQLALSLKSLAKWRSISVNDSPTFFNYNGCHMFLTGGYFCIIWFFSSGCGTHDKTFDQDAFQTP